MKKSKKRIKVTIEKPVIELYTDTGYFRTAIVTKQDGYVMALVNSHHWAKEFVEVLNKRCNVVELEVRKVRYIQPDEPLLGG